MNPASAVSVESLGSGIVLLHRFANQSQCEDLIAYAERSGFKSADVELHNQRAVLLNVRNNQRVDDHNPELAAEIQDTLSCLNRQLHDVSNAASDLITSPYLRFYKYSAGQKFNMHRDGSKQIAGMATSLTFLLYLSDGYQGGATLFRKPMCRLDPVCGDAVIFPHQLWHASEIMMTGIKYVLRTDVASRPRTS